MRKLTIAEQRERELRNASVNYNINIDDLRRLINSYYRYCGLVIRLFNDNNAREEHYNFLKKRIEREEERAEKWFDRLNEQFNKYSLSLVYFGITPTICEKGTTRTAIEKYFYE
ncbi:hypothetical protein [Faecalibacillus intestinalis]|uniref:hypothetical protein n=1 Tax=Faecalibacillus intestinalis TaxID=1982626 RepID=UPI0035217081